MSANSQPNPRTTSHIPVHALVERAELKIDIDTRAEQLETLRNREVWLRHDLSRKIDLHRFACEQSCHRILTRQYADGHAGLDVTFDAVREAEDKLVSVIDDIATAERDLGDMRSTYDDLALWEAR